MPTRRLEQVNVWDHAEARAAYAAAGAKVQEAVAVLQARANQLSDADPATVTWDRAGSAAALANTLVDLVNESR